MVDRKELNMSTLSNALAFIISADNDELNEILSAVKFRREQLARVNRYALTVGAAVKFSHKGTEYRGTVKSVRVKKAVVECAIPNAIAAYDSKMNRVPATVSYTVPLSMLEAA